MNVVLPLGRLTYTPGTNEKPLQLAAVLGRPVLFWLLDSLQLDHGRDVIWIIVSARDEATYQIYSTLSAEYRALKAANRLRLVPLYFKTRGVIETLQVALRYMTDIDLGKRTLCINGDMIFNFGVSAVSRSISSSSVACFLSPTSEIGMDADCDPPHGYQWCHCDVLELCDKVDDTILDNNLGMDDIEHCVECDMRNLMLDRRLGTVMVGAYAFGSAHLLSDLVSKVLQRPAGSMGTTGKLGFPDLIQMSMDRLQRGCRGIFLRGASYTPLKCGEHVKKFIGRTAVALKGCRLVGSSTRYVFQMYGGILNDNQEPRKHVVDVVRQLKELGHHITVSSSRGRGACAVKLLLRQLEEFDIQYDEIELHDDDRDYTVMVGSYVCDARGDLHSALGLPGEVNSLDTVEPRHFNQLTFTSDTVTKKSDAETLSGEAFYYENIPRELVHLFPTLLSKESTADATLCITISKLEGVTFSQLLVNRCITEIHLHSLLQSIKTLHEYRAVACEDRTSSINYYENYAAKVERRFKVHRNIYERICALEMSSTSASVFMKQIISSLKQYEDNNRADVRDFIHGDAVFSNCMCSHVGQTQFIDMNGKLGGVLTRAGDCVYDLAKILQSLYGYDYILLDVRITEADTIILQNLREYFQRHVSMHYPKVSWRDVQLITSSLYVSLIPLHSDFSHQLKFWRMGLYVYECWKNEARMM